MANHRVHRLTTEELLVVALDVDLLAPAQSGHQCSIGAGNSRRAGLCAGERDSRVEGSNFL